MKFQIQVRGSWGGTVGDWRPAIAAPDGGVSNGGVPDGGASGGHVSDGNASDENASDGNPVVAATFGSWDEAEEVLDRMQLAGLLPCGYLEPPVAELRIVDLDDELERDGRGARAGVLLGALEPDGSGQRAA